MSRFMTATGIHPPGWQDATFEDETRWEADPLYHEAIERLTWALACERRGSAVELGLWQAKDERVLGWTETWRGGLTGKGTSHWRVRAGRRGLAQMVGVRDADERWCHPSMYMALAHLAPRWQGHATLQIIPSSKWNPATYTDCQIQWTAPTAHWDTLRWWSVPSHDTSEIAASILGELRSLEAVHG